MRITYNGNDSLNGYVTFTDIPNILSITDDTGGSTANITITLQNSPDWFNATTEDGQWYITFMGETISNVINPANANGKAFYISPTNDNATAASIAKAMRSCPTIAANWLVEHDQENSDAVRVEARSVGAIFANYPNSYSTNVTSQYAIVGGQDGTAVSQLVDSIINVDVYDYGDTNAYITTLEKNFYNGAANFNMSPVLTTLAEYGKTKGYLLYYSYQKNGRWQQLGAMGANYISIGYMVNQGLKDFEITSVHLAQNVNRGATKSGVNNKSTLYVYQPSITMSFYVKSNVGGFNYTINYRDSKYDVITSSTGTWQNINSSNLLKDVEFLLDETTLRSTYYVDIVISDEFTIRYNVIKPLKATEHCQRIYFRNSYGGVSFIDLTSQKTETRETETVTYDTNLYNYYADDNDINELKIPFDNTVDYQYSVKSHLFENDGKYIYNDLLQSPFIWTFINGERYRLLITSISVEEQDNNNVWEATVKYKLSQTPSLV